MPKFAANLSMMFTEWPFLDRFDAAAAAGFAAVEYLFPYDYDAEAIAERLKRNGLVQALFNLPAGDWANGERGIASLPDRFDELKASLERALAYARATGVKRLHLMAGVAERANPAAEANYRRAVAYAADRLVSEGLDLLLEPINARDMPGYFLNDFHYAEALIADLKRAQPEACSSTSTTAKSCMATWSWDCARFDLLPATSRSPACRLGTNRMAKS